MKKPLFDRLTHAYGHRHVSRVLERMLSTSGNDPLRYLTEEAQQVLFERLQAEYRFTKRINARNRAIHRERTIA